MANNRPPKRNSNRYFDEISSQSAPGNLSKELRKALGLSEDMLPIWIYKMRVLGYPPGWCRQAEIQPNLDIIGDDQAKQTENNCEDGEIQPIIYDESATIEYPGYNAAIPKNVKDDWLLLGYPPFMPSSNISSGAQKVSKTETPRQSSSSKSTKPSSPKNSKVTSKDSEDIEVIDCTEDDSDVADSQEDSQTLDDSVGAPENGGSSSHQIGEETNQEAPETSTDPCENNLNGSDLVLPSTPRQKRKFNIIQGESADSYQFKRKSLPDLSKWAEGVTGEMLNFENLPNATGNFNKIRDILSSFRNKKNAPNIEQDTKN